MKITDEELREESKQPMCFRCCAETAELARQLLAARKALRLIRAVAKANGSEGLVFECDAALKQQQEPKK